MASGVYDNKGLFVRTAYLMIALAWYVLTLGGFLYRKSVIVLCYHGVLERQKQRFATQMALLDRGAVSLNLPSALPPVNHGSAPGILITFDDAYANLLNYALPVLQKFRLSALVFPVTQNCGTPPKWRINPNQPEAKEITMTAQQIKNLAQNPLIGWGSHTVTHPDLSRLDQTQVQTELQQSQKQLQQLIQKPIVDLALPHGAFNPVTINIAKDAGYQRIYTLEPKPQPMAHFEGLIGRFSMSPDAWKIEFRLTCTGAYAWLYYVRKMVNYFRPRRKSNDS